MSSKGVVMSDLYEIHTSIEAHTLHCSPSKYHVLGDKLYDYIDSVLDDDISEFIPVAVSKSRPVYVIGVFEDHFEDYCDDRGWFAIQTNADQQHYAQKKTFQLSNGCKCTRLYNTQKLVAYEMSDEDKNVFYVIRVFPSADRIRHIAQMVWFRLQKVSTKKRKEYPASLLRVWSYKKANTKVANWTELEKVLEGRADNAIVILGYARYLRHFVGVYNGDFDTIGEQTLEKPNGVYGCDVIEQEGQTIVFLGIRYTFSGDVLYFLSKKLYEEGASTIIYCGKLIGALNPKLRPNDISVPDKFYTLTTGYGVADPQVSSCGSRRGNKIVRGGNLSISSVLDATVADNDMWGKQQAISTIDTDCGGIAKAAREAGGKLAVVQIVDGSDSLGYASDIVVTILNKLK